ncbi:hypothetical protein ACFQU7_20775 [Pseudoroseomonas wenyumeiae]
MPEYAGIREKVRDLAGGIAGQHACLPLQGAGHFITEAAIRTFVPAGAKLLLVMNGTYADRMARLAREAGRVVVPLAVPDHRSVTPPRWRKPWPPTSPSAMSASSIPRPAAASSTTCPASAPPCARRGGA